MLQGEGPQAHSPASRDPVLASDMLETSGQNFLPDPGQSSGGRGLFSSFLLWTMCVHFLTNILFRRMDMFGYSDNVQSALAA